MDTKSPGKDSLNSEMETNDSDEIVVDSSSPKREIVDVDVIENSSMSSPQGLHIALASDPNTKNQQFIETAKEKRKLYTALTPSFQNLKSSDLRRQSSDPVREHTPSITPYLPKQHSDPGLPRSLITETGESYFNVTCGSLEGRLIWQRFACPGINVRCIRITNMGDNRESGDNRLMIQYNELITPKELVLQAGKQTLKDWKRAIRINGQMLRKLMDNNELDYYRHETTCSNTCKSNKTMSGIDSLGSSRDSSMSSLQASAGSSFEESVIRNNTAILGQRSLERSSSEDSTEQDIPKPEEIVTPENLVSMQQFWKGILQSEMLEDVLKEVMTRLQTIQQRSRTTASIIPEDAITLTNIMDSLDLMPNVKAALANRQALYGDHSVQTSKTVHDLQQKLEMAKEQHEHMKSKKRMIDRTLFLSAPITDKKRRTKLKLPRQAAIDQQRQTTYSPHAINGQILAMGQEYSSVSDLRHSWPHHHHHPGIPLSTTITRLPHNVYVQALPGQGGHSSPLTMCQTHLPREHSTGHSESQSPIRQQEETPPMAYIRSNLATNCTIRSSPDPSTRSCSPMVQK